MRSMRMTGALLLVLACSLLATAAAYLAFQRPATGVDDANIFFVYGRHLATGVGFVYNAGGERVEGSTSLLWTVLCGLAYRFSARPESLLLGVNILLVALTGALGAFALRRYPMDGSKLWFQRDLAWGGAYLVLLLGSPGYVTWSTIALMDGALWATLLLATAILVDRDAKATRGIHPLIVPLLLLLLFARPEALLWVPLFVGVLFVRRIAGDGPRRALLAIAPALAAGLLGTLALTLFRLRYFGHALPNTYYAKVSPSPVVNLVGGAKYLLNYFGDGLLPPLIVTATLIACFALVDDRVRRRGPSRVASALPVFGLTAIAVPVLVGGDHFGAHRLYQYVYPLLLLVALASVRFVMPSLFIIQWRPGLPRRPQLTVAVLATAALLAYLGTEWGRFAKDSQVAKEFAIARAGRAAGSYADELFASLDALPSLGVTAAGGIKLAYAGEVVDLMGLNTTAFAHHPGSRRGVKGHSAFSKQVFVNIAPQVVWPQLVDRGDWEFRPKFIRASFENRVLNGLFDSADFLAEYRFACVSDRRAGPARALAGWYRRDLLDHLRAQAAITVEEFAYPADS